MRDEADSCFGTMCSEEHAEAYPVRAVDQLLTAVIAEYLAL